MLATATMNREGLAVKQASSAGLGRDSDRGWQSCRAAWGYGELQRASSHKGEEHGRAPAELNLFFACSVAALKAPLLVYLFWKWIKRNCRMVCRVQCPRRELRQKSHCSRTLCPQRSLLHVVERWQQQGEEKRERTVRFDGWW